MVGKGLQGEWFHVEAGSGISTITQTRDSYLDLEDYDEVAIYLEVVRVGGAANMVWQTSPTQDSASFVNLLAPFAISASPTPVVNVFLAGYCAVPLARFLRWQLSGVNGWGAVFRVSIAAHAPGA